VRRELVHGASVSKHCAKRAVDDVARGLEGEPLAQQLGTEALQRRRRDVREERVTERRENVAFQMLLVVAEGPETDDGRLLARQPQLLGVLSRRPPARRLRRHWAIEVSSIPVLEPVEIDELPLLHLLGHDEGASFELLAALRCVPEPGAFPAPHGAMVLVAPEQLIGEIAVAIHFNDTGHFVILCARAVHHAQPLCAGHVASVA
jgi:hypothetical protein